MKFVIVSLVNMNTSNVIYDKSHGNTFLYIYARNFKLFFPDYTALPTSSKSKQMTKNRDLFRNRSCSSLRKYFIYIKKIARIEMNHYLDQLHRVIVSTFIHQRN